MGGTGLMVLGGVVLVTVILTAIGITALGTTPVWFISSIGFADQNMRVASDELMKQLDLAAQQSMATWAKGMFWIAVVQTFITFVGVILVYLTLKSAREGVVEAEKAAKAAQAGVNEAIRAANAAIDSLKFAEQSAEQARRGADASRDAGLAAMAAERAYLFVRHEDVQVEIDPVGMDKARIVLRARNFGRSPGFISTQYAKARDLDHLPDDIDYDEAQERTVVQPPVQPGDSVAIFAIQRQYTDDKFVHIAGYIKYKDIFGAMHVTRFSIALQDYDVTRKYVGGQKWHEWT